MRRHFLKSHAAVAMSCTVMIALAGSPAAFAWQEPARQAAELTAEQKEASAIGVVWLALLDGEITGDSYAPARLADPAVAALKIGRAHV